MENFKEITKARIKKGLAKASAAGGPSKKESHKEIEDESIENQKKLEALKPTLDKESAKKEAKAAKSELIEHETKPIPDLPEYNVEPVTNPNEICSFCGEEFTAQGIGRHVAAKHKAPGITLEDINRMNQGEITPPELLDEKGITTIYGLSPEIEKKYFSKWVDTEKNPKPSGEIEDPEKEKPGPKDQGEVKEAPEENGAHKLSPAVRVMGGIAGGLTLAAIILPRIDPRFKEITDKLLATLGDLGSKKFPQSPGKKSYGQHAIDVNRARNNR